MKNKQSKSLLVKSMALTGLFTISACANEELADTLLTNTHIYGHNNATSLAIKDGKIVYIGDEQNAMSHVSNKTQVIDLKDGYLLPGFVDNHNHVFEAASEIGSDCLLDEDKDIKGYIRSLHACKAELEEGEWLLGYGHELSQLMQDNDTSPLAILDEIFPNNPVVIMEQTSHSMWVNSLALAEAGITTHSQDPQGGKILKDITTGKLLGILLDNAGDLLMEQAWKSQPNLQEANYQGLLNGLAQASKHGITTIGDGRLYWKRGWLETWLTAEKNQALTARVSLRPWVYPADEANEQLAFLKKIKSTDKQILIQINQVKIYSDGIIINGTASTLDPYDWSYTPQMPHGLEYIPATKMTWWLSELNKIGYGAHIHAIGDAGVRNTLNAIETLRAQGATTAYSMTHLEMVSAEDIKRFAPLRVDADFQLGSDYIAEQDHDWAIPFIGKQRAHALLPINAILNTGANVTLSSDWNVNDINPLVGIANALYLKNIGIADIHQAIAAYTINAAQALGLDDVTGTLDVGKSADIVMLERDITQSTPTQIASTRVLMTWLEGEVVYDEQTE